MQAVLLILLGLLAVTAVWLALGAVKTRKLAAEARASVPQAGERMDVSGGAIHYLDLGPREAPVLVMIHGLGGQMHHFTYAMTGLLEDDFRLIVIDRPGCGYSLRDDEAQAALTEQARMIWEMLDRLGVTRPVLVGHSLGGAVSLGMAVQRPAETGALALLAPLTHPNTAASPAFDGLNQPNRRMRHLLARTWAVPMARRTAIETLTEVFRPEPWPADFLDRGGASLGLRPEAFLASVEDYMASAGIGAIAAQYDSALTMPGGVLFGSGDALLDPQEQGAAMTAHGLEFTALPDRGHMIPITAPADCATFVRRIAGRLG
ncbi:alpha/beta fold hydrolase [Marinibacterium profundimaris]|uniref:AB hydrolase-1 domain-containing protein n=1 Tax=Marinibacterium profundimaris TaxID=1679460 RepID=A0A225NBU9_9RHOB|nr:alpha/beta hydrolase [Marinibacterium profundimaris]OWU66448.1 hypothetical protein ATO3_27985 [Marinibacterium profundimaris]